MKIKMENISDKAIAYLDNLCSLGEYKITKPFQLNGGLATYFELEEADHTDPNYGNTIYFYLQDPDGEQIDGVYIYEVDNKTIENFYNTILLNNHFEKYGKL